MSYDIPSDLQFLETHEWVRTDDSTARIGISEFAQEELGDVVFVELPGVGDDVTAGEEFGVVESIKAVSDLYAPVSGAVTAVNEDLFDQPERINEDPYGDGWLLELELADENELDDLLSATEYEDQIV